MAPIRFGTYLAVSLAFGVAKTLASAQQLTPRDAFWSASDLVSVSNNTAAAPKREHRTQPRASQPASHSAAATPAAGKHIDPTLVATSGYGAAPHLVRVSSEEMGLRYSLLLEHAPDVFAEVSPQTVFHSGERIRLSLMANQPGYLYVVEHGASGAWSPIYPAPGAAPEANHIDAGKLTMVPSRSAFRFDPPAGEEKLYVIVSRTPLTDLDATIQNLKGAGVTKRPAPEGQMLEASNHIPDDLMQHLASRDLSLVQEQQVDDASAGNDGEKAVYVVSHGVPPGASGPQVVAAITLKHE